VSGEFQECRQSPVTTGLTAERFYPEFENMKHKCYREMATVLHLAALILLPFPYNLSRRESQNLSSRLNSQGINENAVGAIEASRIFQSTFSFRKQEVCVS